MKRGFTFLEVLLALAAIATIAGVLVTIVRPVEMFKCARDVQRINDLKSLDSAIRYYIVSLEDPDLDGPYNQRGFDENSSTIFISAYSDKESIPSSTVVDQKTWSINAVNFENAQKIDGNGWLPINFSNLSRKPLGHLPVDPINSFSNKFFYSYVFHRNNRGFELNAKLECPRYTFGGREDQESTDGGDDPHIFEIGSFLTLLPSELYGTSRMSAFKPAIRVSEINLNLNVSANSVSSTKLTIYNTGSTTLTIYNVIKNPENPRISVDNNYFSVYPGSQNSIKIICSAKDIYQATTTTTTIELWNNDWEWNPLKVNVTCNITEAPRISLSKSSLEITTRISSSSTERIIIYNKGQSNLNIESLDYYLQDSTTSCPYSSFTLSSPSIPPNSSSTLQITLNASQAQKAERYSCKLYIGSNDPYRQSLIVIVRNTIQSKPDSPTISGITPEDKKIVLVWDPPSNNGYSNIISYKIYRKIDAIPTQSDDYTSTTLTQFIDENLINGTNYCYRISAVNAIGESELSDTACGIPKGLPGSPSLSVTPGNRSVKLDWNQPNLKGGALTSYEINRRIGNTSSTFPVGTVTSTIDRDLNNCQTYYYQVRAITDVGAGAWSNIASATPMGTSTPPKNLQATTTADSVILNWQAPDYTSCAPIIYYEIYRSTTSDSNFVRIATTTDTTFTDSNVESNAEYWYYITAVNSYGASDPSQKVKAHTSLAKCNPPPNLSATPGDRKITLSWTQSDSLNPGDYYFLYFTTGTIYQKFATVTHPTNTYTHTNLINGNTYSYYVTAQGSNCVESNPSNIVTSTPGTVPSAPLNFQARAFKDRIELSWKEPISNGGYPILSYSLYKGNQLIATTSSSVRSFVDYNISPDSTYEYSVSAVNAFGEGEKAHQVTGFCPVWSFALGDIVYGSLSYTIPHAPHSVYLLSDGGYLITGVTNHPSGLGGEDGLLIKVDSFGNIEWMKLYGGPLNDSVSSAVELPDGLIITGIINDDSTLTGSDIFLAKVNKNDGNIIWAKILGSRGLDEAPYLAIGGNYLYLGFTTYFLANRDMVLMKLDLDGNIKWSKRYPLRNDDVLVKVFYKKDTVSNKEVIYLIGYRGRTGFIPLQYLISSRGSDLTVDGFVAKVNPINGEIIYFITFDINGFFKIYSGWGITDLNFLHDDFLYDAIVKENSLILAGRTFALPRGDSDFLVIYLNDPIDAIYQPHVIGSFIIGGWGDDNLYSIREIENHDYPYLLGESNSLGARNFDLLVIKAGKTQFPHYYSVFEVKTFGGPNDDMNLAVPITNTTTDSLPSNKILIAASTKISGNQYIWLIKTDSNLSLGDKNFPPSSSLVYKNHPTTSVIIKDAGSYLSTFYINVTPHDFISNPSSTTSLQSQDVSLNRIDYISCKASGITIPSPPRNLTGENKGSYNELKWDAPSSNGGSAILQYKIYRKESLNNYYLLGTTSPSTLIYSDYNIEPGKTYFYRVTAVNAKGESLPSNEVRIDVPVQGALPSAPYNLQVTPGGSQNLLSWSYSGAPVDYYKIYLAKESSYSLIATSSATNYTHSNLIEGEEYCYVVTAVNSVGESGYSNKACGTIISVPSPPQNLRVSLGDKQLILNWDSPIRNGGSPITEYRIYRNGVFLASVSSSTLSYTDSNVTPGVYYTYYVTAKNSVGESAPSNSFTIKAGALPGKWEITVEDYGSDFVKLRFSCSEQPSIKCDGGYPIEKIEIYRGYSPTTLSLYSTTSQYHFIDSNVSSDTTYYYAIKAYNQIGGGPTSSVVSVTAQPREIPSAVYQGFVGVTYSTYNEAHHYIIEPVFKLSLPNLTYIKHIQFYVDYTNLQFPYDSINIYCGDGNENDRALFHPMFYPLGSGVTFVKSVYITSGTNTISIYKDCKNIYFVLRFQPIIGERYGSVSYYNVPPTNYFGMANEVRLHVYDKFVRIPVPSIKVYK